LQGRQVNQGAGKDRAKRQVSGKRGQSTHSKQQTLHAWNQRMLSGMGVEKRMELSSQQARGSTRRSAAGGSSGGAVRRAAANVALVRETAAAHPLAVSSAPELDAVLVAVWLHLHGDVGEFAAARYT
jgi:hypothetical protein